MHTNVYRNFDRREEDGRMKNINQMRMHFEHEDTTQRVATRKAAKVCNCVQVHSYHQLYSRRTSKGDDEEQRENKNISLMFCITVAQWLKFSKKVSSFDIVRGAAVHTKHQRNRNICDFFLKKIPT